MKIELTGQHTQWLYRNSLGGVFLGFSLRASRISMRMRRLNGTKKDLEGLQFDLPGDGIYKWMKGEVRGNGFVYGQRRQNGKYEYAVEYHAGAEDKKWFCQVDCNYLARILREGNLQTKEPEVWALRELDRARGERVDDIRVWWRTKVFLPNVGELLETAKSIFVGKLLVADFIRNLPQIGKNFEQGLLNIIKEYLGFKIIRPGVAQLAQPTLSASRVTDSERGVFSREHYERKDREAERAAETSTKPEVM